MNQRRKAFLLRSSEPSAHYEPGRLELLTCDLRDKNNLASVREKWKKRKKSLLLREGRHLCTLRATRRLICGRSDPESSHPHLSSPNALQKQQIPHDTNILTYTCASENVEFTIFPQILTFQRC